MMKRFLRGALALVCAISFNFGAFAQQGGGGGPPPNITIGTPADTVGTLGALGALNNTCSVALNGQNGAGMFLAAGTLIGTITPELSMDGGTTWVSTQFFDPVTGLQAPTIVFGSANTVTSRGIVVTSGASNVRVRVSAYTSGTANCTNRATIANIQGAPILGGAYGTTPPLNSWLMLGVRSSSGNVEGLTTATSGLFSPLLVTNVPLPNGYGLTNFLLQPTATDNHQTISTGQHQVYHISVSNNSATANYLRLYDAASGFNGCNSATGLVYEMEIYPNTVTPISDDWPMGMKFVAGLSICVTSGYAKTDVTNATATAINLNIGYI